EHAEDHREQGRRVDAERHRGDVSASGAAHEPYGEPGIGEVSGQYSEGGAGNHPLQDEVGRELEDADQKGREDDELSDVVEGEAEEAVQVPGSYPAQARASRIGRRLLPDR